MAYVVCLIELVLNINSYKGNDITCILYYFQRQCCRGDLGSVGCIITSYSLGGKIEIYLNHGFAHRIILYL